MSNFIPFATVAQETSVRAATGELTIASDETHVVIHGSIELRHDRLSLEATAKLIEALTQIINTLEGSTLADTAHAGPAANTSSIDNPFN